jgi:hypothetical protein
MHSVCDLTSRPLKSALRFLVFFPELVDAAFGIDQFLFAGKERVAERADVQSYLGFGRSRFECVAARTMDLCYFIARMNLLFHGFLLLLIEKPSHSRGAVARTLKSKYYTKLSQKTSKKFTPHEAAL